MHTCTAVNDCVNRLVILIVMADCFLRSHGSVFKEAVSQEMDMVLCPVRAAEL